LSDKRKTPVEEPLDGRLLLQADNTGWHRSTGILLAAAAVALATFPWEITDHAHWRRIVWVPFAGILRPADLLVNGLLYVPLGLALQWRRSRDMRLIGAVIAAALSIAMETAQIWSHFRFPSATDVAMNVVGALAGVAWIRRRSGLPGRRHPAHQRGHPVGIEKRQV
jgi:hypothetical protein